MGMDWPHLLAYITGTVDRELLLRNEYLAAENRILGGQIKGRLCLSQGEKATLAEIAQRLGRRALAEVAVVAKPETILRWFRRLVARKFDGSRLRQIVGRPRIVPAIENLIVRMARENSTWGYDRIVGALRNLGHTVSDQTVGNILKRHGIAPAPQRKHTTRWRDFIRAHMDVLTGTDFFTVEVLTLKGLMTYYVLFFIQLETRRVCLTGITPYPDQAFLAPSSDPVHRSLQLCFIVLTSLCGWKFETVLQRCWYCGVSMAVTYTLNEFGRGVRLECTLINNPGTIVQRVLRFNLPTFDRNAQGPAAHSQ